MSALPFLDCNARIGRPTRPRRTEAVSAVELLQDMDRCGIQQALVYHVAAREHAPAVGNALLAREIGGTERLAPCWTLLPDATLEGPGADAVVDQMLAAGARAARLFPSSHRFLLSASDSDRLLGVLAERRVPVLLSLDEGGWAEVSGLLARHPLLRLILLDVGYRCDRYLYPLLDTCRELRVETATYAVHRGIEALADRFGADCLVFGTGAPLHDPAGAIAAVTYADLDHTARRLIAGDTLRRLLAEVV